MHNKGEDVVVCLPGARIEHVTERVEKIMGRRGKGGTILVHVGTNNADKEGTKAIVDKYRNLLKKTKESRVGQIILSGILPVFGNRIDGYRNSKQMAINAFFHLTNNNNFIPRSEPDHDPLFKLGKPFLILCTKFHDVYYPHKEISIDERTIPWTGNIRFRTYNHAKPDKYGIKSYEL